MSNTEPNGVGTPVGAPQPVSEYITAMLTRRERDLLRGQVGFMLRGDSPDTFMDDREQLVAIVGETTSYLAIVDQLGWDEDGDPRDAFEITMPADEFAGMVRQIRGYSAECIADEANNLALMASPDGMAEYRFADKRQQAREVEKTRKYMAREERTVAACDAILERMEATR